MEQTELETIIRAVTREVLSALNQDPDGSPSTEGLRRLLVVGGTANPLPEELSRGAILCELSDFEACRNILRYNGVVIAHLTMLQMADIALGRPSEPASCAVLYALLSGVEVCMLENALSFRRFAGKGSTALYQMLEGYARQLQVFGVKQISRQRRAEPPPAKPPRFAAPPREVPAGTAAPNADRLITEARALELIRGGGEIRLPDRAIVTPAARDVFAQAGVVPGQNH